MQKSLSYLLSALPPQLDYENQKVEFALRKTPDGYICEGYVTDNTPAESHDLSFSSNTPEDAIQLMLDHLKETEYLK